MNPSSPERSDVAAMLEEHRARLTDTERDDIRRRATATRPVTSRSARRGAALRGRTAITSLLAAGLVMTSGGAALGVSALSETRSAKAAQYGTAPNSGAGSGTSGTAPNSGAGAGTSGTAPNSGAGTLAGAAGAERSGSQPAPAAGRSEDQPPAATAQAPRQLESGDSELPFTGYVSGFVLLAGLGTLAAGLTLRRGTRRAPTGA